jgi:23S rRNA (cytidine1920-2'-O)/16S rRNA (cytidine1409-2'-O)-methyltransferase
VLVKPQFEVGRGMVGGGGVVRDPRLRRDAVRRVAAALAAAGWVVAGAVRAHPPGPKGNVETFLLAGGPASGLPEGELEAGLASATGDPGA